MDQPTSWYFAASARIVLTWSGVMVRTGAGAAAAAAAASTTAAPTIAAMTTAALMIAAMTTDAPTIAASTTAGPTIAASTTAAPTTAAPTIAAPSASTIAGARRRRLAARAHCRTRTRSPLRLELGGGLACWRGWACVQLTREELGPSWRGHGRRCR